MGQQFLMQNNNNGGSLSKNQRQEGPWERCGGGGSCASASRWWSPIQHQHLWGRGRHLYNLLNPVRRCSCSSGVGQGTQPERGGLGLSKEGLKGVEEQRRRGKEGLKLLLLFVKVKVLSLSPFRIIIFCGFCFLFSAWWGLGGAESTRDVKINQIQKN